MALNFRYLRIAIRNEPKLRMITPIAIKDWIEMIVMKKPMNILEDKIWWESEKLEDWQIMLKIITIKIVNSQSKLISLSEKASYILRKLIKREPN